MISKLQEKVIAQQKEIEKLETEEATPQSPATAADPCLDCKPELGWMWLYVLMPVILSIGAALYFIGWLKREGYKISSALSDDVPEERLEEVQAVQMDMLRARTSMMVANAADPANKQTIPPLSPADQPNIPMNRSSSRLIAFLSSLSASILAICIFSFYMYFAIKGMKVPEFEDLWPILTALGLGIVPYATKVINEKDEK
ncbi:hypothetical protein B0E43_13285 [Algoriphagus sp. A40]|nr:hypothetical protein B0E43_13285 [Algoriphagus sp. A40]